MTIEVILDARNWTEPLDAVGDVLSVWNRVSSRLLNQTAVVGQPLEICDEKGVLRLWIVAAPLGASIQQETEFRCLDVLRNPKLLYICQICGLYGPLRCARCEDEGQPERICSKDARFVKDELAAYCQAHIPPCGCTPGCDQKAEFRCRRCHRLFGEHSRREHPRDRDVDYCERCYQHLFERCIPCKEERRWRLGKSKCAFTVRGSRESCGAPLCWDHSTQWRVWGANNRGITLCPTHVQQLASGDPADFLFTLLMARPPITDQGKRAGLPNLFRLRRLLNLRRVQKLAPGDMLQALLRLEVPIRELGFKRLSEQFEFMKRSYTELLQDVAAREPLLLAQIRAYYSQKLGSQWANAIQGLEIVDRFGKPARYRIELFVNASNKGPMVGPRGSTINPLKNQLGIEIELEGGRA